MQVTKRCMVIDCRAPAVANGVCRKHYMRIKRHGSVEQTRPKDWGARESHPLYSLWSNLKRNRSEVICQRWLQDFWAFVGDVQDRPVGSGRATLERVDCARLLGPDNFYWAAPTASMEERAEKSERMRKWRADKLQANEDYFRDAEYQKRYGVTLEWYNEQLAKQGGVCAIHGGSETTKIRGKVIRLAVDHDHETGKARALLCKECNQAIGLLHHKAARATAAAEYLSFHQPTDS